MNFNLLYRRSVSYQELEGVLDSSIHHCLLQCTSNQPVEEGINNFYSLDLLQICQKILSVYRQYTLPGNHSCISRTLGGGPEMRLFK